MAVASVASEAATEILMPGSEDEAIAAFGDGADVVVVGGGTIVVPDLTYRRLRPSKALMLGRAGLAGIERRLARDDRRDDAGPGARRAAGAARPLRVERRRPRDPLAGHRRREPLRAEGDEAPRGDLQGAFLALGATVRSAANGEVTEEPLEEFLPKRHERLLLSVSFEEPAAGAFAGLDRPHTHDYTALAVSGDAPHDGTLRLAATGAGSWGVGFRRPRLWPETRCGGRGGAEGRHTTRRRARLGLVPDEGAARARAPRPHRAGGVRMNLTVNGIAHEVDGRELTPLLDVLRDELGVTGPKAGCHQGGCGSCTVLVDGEPRRSCLLPAGYADGTEITTVEGLGTPEDLAPIQQAFVHYYAAQCGFCTSGMMLAAQAYIDRGGSDDPEAIQHALGGHVCRCTGYSKIIDAVAAAARGDSFDLTTTAVGKHTTMATGGAE